MAMAITKVFGPQGSVFAAMTTVRHYTPTPNTYEFLVQSGFKCRVSNGTPLSEEEKDKIKDFLVRLRQEGPKVMFPYQKPLRYIARVVLHGERSDTKVASLARQLLVKYTREMRDTAAVRSEVATTSNTGLVPGLAEMVEVAAEVLGTKVFFWHDMAMCICLLKNVLRLCCKILIASD